MSDPVAKTKAKILVQLDADPQPSVFDGVVAVDAGVDHLFRHGQVTPDQVTGLVHGALFTRGPADLRSSAIFVGGSDLARAEALLEAVRASFFGPFRVSVLLDPNGANTTAAAAVLAAIKATGGVEGRRIAVMGATGPVGGRVARLLVGLGAIVAVGSRDRARSEALATRLASSREGAKISAFSTGSPEMVGEGLAGASVAISAGAAGAMILPRAVRQGLTDLEAVIDLNAVPPLGIEGIEPNDRGVDRDGNKAWGALGIGQTKMKIHKAAIRALFESNDAVLDAEELLGLGRDLA